MTRVEIDVNVRLGRDRTYVGFEDVYGLAVHPGEVVEVFSGEWITGSAVVDEVDYAAGLIYLRLEWSALTLTELAHGTRG